MATKEKIDYVANRLREQTVKNQRSRIVNYLRKNSSFLQSRPLPPAIRSIFDISQRVLPTYHDDLDLEKLLEKIDLGKIYSVVEDKDEEQQVTGKYKDKNGVKLAYSDFLVQELLKWYKEEFFQWVNKPDCPTCGDSSSVQAIGRTQPNQEEAILGGAAGVELYRCGKCQLQIRFPRYNKLGKLLEWRKGRCGEWNNCFMLLLNAINVRARYLWNAEDHVWCEYYSELLQRWVHLDSCENSWDEPLLYNKGWGKKMSYVFAIGDDYIVDVSDKYIVKDKLPRNQLSESDLQKILCLFNLSKWIKFDDFHLYKVLLEYNKELKLTTSTTSSSLKPRQSGLGEWTQTRGESGV